MASFQEHTHVFIVRLWREPREIEGELPEWRGVVEYLAGAERLYFQDLGVVVPFIVDKTGATSLQPRPATQRAMPGRLFARLLQFLGLHK